MQPPHKPTIQYLIQKFQLDRHPEGGFYRRVFRSAEQVSVPAAPSRFTAVEHSQHLRPAMSSIYYLLESQNPSTWHRLRADEMWHFYHGDPCYIYEFDTAGLLQTTKLGNPLTTTDAIPQHTIPWGRWFAVETIGQFSFCGCTVAPGFEFADFELGKAESLIKQYPNSRELILRLSRHETIQSQTAERDGFKKQKT